MPSPSSFIAPSSAPEFPPSSSSARPPGRRLRPAIRWMLRVLPAAAMVSAALADAIHGGAATEAPVDKWQFHLFNPVPRKAMREMSTDRPDQTESAYTVDAGHFQVEGDMAKGTFDTDRSHGGKVRSRTLNFASMNLKAGLLNNVDIQFVIDSYEHSRVEDRVSRMVEKASGFGNVETRLKINLWGNDGGATALAIMPYVKWPLPKSGLRNGKTEGGVIIPLAVELPGGWGMGAMTEFDFVRNEEGGYDTEFVNSITFGHQIAGKLSGYLEFFSVTGDAPGFDWIGQVDAGLTYAVNDNFVLDFGCNFGVTEAAPDFNPFIGFSFRY